jgi:hypothetical protein
LSIKEGVLKRRLEGDRGKFQGREMEGKPGRSREYSVLMIWKASLERKFERELRRGA